MILHPGILALTVGSLIVLAMLLYAYTIAIKILRNWNINSSTEEQLLLERKTYLVSTMVQYSLAFEIISIFLFIYTADDIHRLLVGAMCATGSLNANSLGFPALYAKIVMFFLSAAWIALNYIDNCAEDYPLIKTKYLFLVFLIPVAITEIFLQTNYFLNLSPNVITSCCGVLFSEEGESIASSLASFPVLPMKIVFYGSVLNMTFIGILMYRRPNSRYAWIFSFAALAMFIISILSVISFISLYFYQLPTHHCPFDILQAEYYYIGYPLYISLFSGSFFGMMVGPISIFRHISSLREVIKKAQQRWTLISVAGVLIFTVIASIPILFLPFAIKGY